MTNTPIQPEKKLDKDSPPPQKDKPKSSKKDIESDGSIELVSSTVNSALKDNQNPTGMKSEDVAKTT